MDDFQPSNCGVLGLRFRGWVVAMIRALVRVTVIQLGLGSVWC